MQDNTKWYWEQKNTTEQYHCSHTHNCKYMLGCHHSHQGKKTQKNICNKSQEQKAIQMSTICLTDSDHYFIRDEIKIE